MSNINIQEIRAEMKNEMMDALREQKSFIQKMSEREYSRSGSVTEETAQELEFLKEIEVLLSKVKV